MFLSFSFGKERNREEMVGVVLTVFTDPVMWYHGGTIGQARYYSRFIALQVKARLLGTPLPLYEKKT